MEREKYYLFKPEVDRPTKRRRVDRKGLEDSRILRERTYNELWGEQERRIELVRQESNEATAEAISAFVSAPHDAEYGTRIPTGFIVTGPSNGSSASFFEYLSSQIKREDGSLFVSLWPDECPNLKTLLKVLIRKATSSSDRLGEEDEDGPPTNQRSSKPLSYDLELLCNWLKGQEVSHVAIALQQVEAFEGSLLSETVELLHCWLPRIPFVLLFGIGTSLDFFEERLPRSATRCMKGLQFDVAPADEVFERVFHTVSTGPQVRLWIGAAVAEMLVTRQKEQVQMVSYCVDAVKYAYMSHFFANPLSVLLRDDLRQDMMTYEVYEALRNLPSFRREAELLLEKGDTELVADLLQSDQGLCRYISESVTAGKISLDNLTGAVQVIRLLRQGISKTSPMTYSDLYVRAMSGVLNGSPLVRDLLLSVRKAPSDVLVELINTVSEFLSEHALIDGLNSIQAELDLLLSNNTDSTGPMRSEHDVRRGTLRTTVVSQKVELSKQKATLSKQDTAYSKLVDQFHQFLTEYLDAALINPKELFLKEILVFDLAFPHRDVFIARPRYTLERALSVPHDYLSCDCCPKPKGNERNHSISTTHPPTSILYQLYLESGSLINVADLWAAFNSVLSRRNSEQTNMGLFQHGLAELKYLGVIKGSKRKADHIAKLLWKGL